MDEETCCNCIDPHGPFNYETLVGKKCVSYAIGKKFLEDFDPGIAHVFSFLVTGGARTDATHHYFLVYYHCENCGSGGWITCEYGADGKTAHWGKYKHTLDYYKTGGMSMTLLEFADAWNSINKGPADY